LKLLDADAGRLGEAEAERRLEKLGSTVTSTRIVQIMTRRQWAAAYRNQSKA